MNRSVVITGAAGGIGRAAVTKFSNEGWRIFAVDTQPITRPGVESFQRDVSDPKNVQTIFDELRTRVGEIDALVNNAAIQVTKTLTETSPEEWDRVMAVNVRSAFLTTKAAVPVLRHRNGSIVNVSSVHAVATSSRVAAYAASKGALVALTRASAIELASDQIRVNALLPGAVDTDMLREGVQRQGPSERNVTAALKELASRTVMQRIGTPEEISEAIYFLASHRSSFMTGQALIVDGGATARLSTE